MVTAETIIAALAVLTAGGAGARQLWRAAQAVTEMALTVRGLVARWDTLESRLSAVEAAWRASAPVAPVAVTPMPLTAAATATTIPVVLPSNVFVPTATNSAPGS